MMEYNVVVDKKSIPVTVTQKKMKTVRLKVFPSGQVYLSVPVNTPDEWIADFIKQKTKWIAEKTRLFEQTKPIEKEDHIRSGITTRILGRQVLVQIESATQKRIEKNDAQLTIYTTRPDEQADVDKQFNNWWQRTSKDCFVSIMDDLYPIIQKHGINKPEIVVKKMKTLWGSCSRKHEKINLNFYLYKAPLPCVEYVILHELVHFIFPKHNKDFYDFLTIKMPDWQERKRLLDYEIVYGV